MAAALHAMFVHAHPDDESSKGAATMARYVKEGYRVSVVTLTDGSAGEILNPNLDPTTLREPLVDVRRRELADALALLGVTEHYDMGYIDSGWVEDFDGDGSRLPEGTFYRVPMAEVLGRLIPLLRATRPDVVVTYDERGGYPHPDHVRTHQVTIAAVRAAAEPQQFPGTGPVWRPAKIYYHMTFTRQRLERLHHALVAEGLESPFSDRLKGWDRGPERVTTSVDVGDFLGQARAALRAHATQIDPEGHWFVAPEDVVRQTYPFEDYRLAFSEVWSPRPERSLFAGLE